MKKVIIISTILFISIINPLYAGEDEWTSIMGPPGGYSIVADFSPSPYNWVYASSDSFLYKSPNDGSEWSWSITDHPQHEFRDIKIGKSPLSGYYVFTATTDNIYRGFNGTGWQEVYNDTCWHIVIDREQSGYIYAIAKTVSGPNVIRSTDFGNNWFPIQVPGNWTCLEIDPFEPMTIYVGHLTDGLRVSYDAGNNWFPLGFSGKKVWDIDVAPDNNSIIFTQVCQDFPDTRRSEIWKSTDGGQNWYLVLSSDNSEHYNQVVISQPSPNTIFAVMRHGGASPIKYSYYEGEPDTWQWLQPELGWPQLAIQNLNSAPITDGRYIISASDGLMRSDDFLHSYYVSYSGLKPRYTTTTLTTGQLDENFIICNGIPKAPNNWWCEPGHIWKTTNGGDAWQPYPDIIHENEDPLRPEQIRIMDQNRVYLRGYTRIPNFYGFFLSEDAGQSYTNKFPLHLPFAYFDVFHEDTVYLIGNSGSGASATCHLWLSEYPFSVWDERSAYTPGKGYCLRIHPFNPDTLFFGGLKTDGVDHCWFWKSYDGGQNYLNPANNGLPTQPGDNNIISSIVTSHSTSDQPVVLFCGLKKRDPDLEAELGVYKSTNFGENWQLANLEEEINELKVDLLDPSIIYAATPNGIFITHDYANHWISSNQGLGEVANQCNAIDLSTNRPHLFCGTDHGVFKFSPIKILSGSSLTTAYQARKMLIKDEEAHFVYQTPGGIYFVTSDLNGQTKIREIGVKQGAYPALDFDANDNPCIVWQRNVEVPPSINCSELWYSRYDGFTWTEPHCLISFTSTFGCEVNLPGFIIDQSTNTGYVTFEEREWGMNGPVSRLYLGWFPINNPADTHFIELENVWSPVRCEFPSISLGYGYLYIVFQRDNKIYRYKRNISTGAITKLLISLSNRLSHHPYVDVEANRRINYVWEDSTANNIEIYWGYEYREAYTHVGNVSNTLGKSQWPQICKGTTYITWSEYIYPPTDNNWDIFYKNLEYTEIYNLSGDLETSKYSHGVITTSLIHPPRLTAIWTEKDQSPYEIKVKTVNVNPEPAYYYVDAGREEPSPWTIQRQGYIQFDDIPEKTIDYHEEKLIYHFPNLKTGKRYQIELVFYFESQNQDPWKMRINADNIFHANQWVNPGEVTTLNRWLPAECYADGEIYLEIEKKVGNYALIAQIMIYEYEQEEQGDNQNAQGTGNIETEKLSISIIPNPCHSQARIHYSIPANGKHSAFNLKIYDAAGRLVKNFARSTHDALCSTHLVWDGTDEYARVLAGGVYFVVLEGNNECLTEKLVLLK